MDEIYVQELEFGKKPDLNLFRGTTELFLSVTRENWGEIAVVQQENIYLLPIQLVDTNIGTFLRIQDPLISQKDYDFELDGTFQSINQQVSSSQLELAEDSAKTTISSITGMKLQTISYLPQKNATKTFIGQKISKVSLQKTLISHTGKELIFQYLGPSVPSSHKIVQRWIEVFSVLDLNTETICKVYITIKGELLE